MTSRDIRKINEQFANGVLPEEFNFTGVINSNIDWDKVRYNAFYRSPEYFLNKYPKGFENLPGADKIIDEMILQCKSPLEEMNERKQESINKIWEETILNLSVNDIDDQSENDNSSPSSEK